MEFRLITFLTVCKEMNFTRAAELLHITQPAVSQQIRWLEEDYKMPLFRHEGKKIYLTEAGHLLFDAVITMQNDEDVLRRRILASKDTKTILRLGATRTIGEFGIASALAGYIRSHPEIKLNLSIGNTEELLQELRQGTLQCAMVEGYFDPCQFDFEKFCTEEYIAVCAKGHRFKKEPQNMKDLINESLLLREPGSGTREILDKFLGLQNMRLHDFSQVIQIGSMQVIIKLLSQDLGISFMYRMAAQQGLNQKILKEISLPGFPIKHDFTLVWKRNSHYTEEYRQFCHELIKI